MKKISLLSLISFFNCLLLSTIAHSQAGEWTWMKGTAGNASNAVYGTQGVPAAANTPQGLYEPCEWRANDGTFWLYGGSDENYYLYNNLWKYDPSTNEWTWVKGPGNVTDLSPYYGTQGIPSLSNTPGARGWCVSTWVDNSGDLWLLGGRDPNGGDAFGDLWKYNIATNEWTWMQGPNTLGPPGIYGTQTVADAANHPGGRSETCATWTDANNNLWMFGGYGYDKFSTLGLLNDVWKYDINTNEWAWMRGSTTSNNAGSYGTKGVTDSSNNPKSRMVFTKWKDLSGNFWIFAGGDWNDNTSYNDVWKYEPSINQWTWMSGTNLVNDDGLTDTFCASGIDLVGPGRIENRCCWTDSCGNFWTFGGGRGSSIDVDYNDVWNFNPQTLEWTMVKGSTIMNQNGSYGTQGVSSPTNDPHARGGMVSWIGIDGTLWTWGGVFAFTTFYNDMWRYVINTSCPAIFNCQQQVFPNFSASDTALCEKFCIDFYDSSQNNPIAWLWLFPGGTPSSSTDQNPTSICYQSPGIFDVTLITTTAGGTDTVTLHNYITVYATPPFPTITQLGYTLTSSVAASYQWQFNSIDIPGATNQSYTIGQTGFYTVLISDSNGCVNSATQYVLISGIDEVSDGNVFIYPNPTSDNLMIELLNACPAGCGSLVGDEITFLLSNTIGQEVYSSEEKILNADWKKEINLSDIARGVYFIEVHSSHLSLRRKIIIQ